jgi:hypothetical protein
MVLLMLRSSIQFCFDAHQMAGQASFNILQELNRGITLCDIKFVSGDIVAQASQPAFQAATLFTQGDFAIAPSAPNQPEHGPNTGSSIIANHRNKLAAIVASIPYSPNENAVGRAVLTA